MSWRRRRNDDGMYYVSFCMWLVTVRSKTSQYPVYISAYPTPSSVVRIHRSRKMCMDEKEIFIMKLLYP